MQIYELVQIKSTFTKKSWKQKKQNISSDHVSFKYKKFHKYYFDL